MAKNEPVLITGASSGIGRALALLYAAPERVLLLAGRDAARLESVAALCREKGAAVETSATAVTEREALARQVRAWDDAYEIHTIIANAGISGGMGKEGGESDAQFYDIMSVNVDGVLNTVLPLLPRLKARGRGHIVLMSSMAGFRGLPTAPAYSVSKNAVRAWGEALRPMLLKYGVHVSTIHPGFIRTPLTDVNTFLMPLLMEVEDAAARMKKGIDARKPVIAFPWQIALFMELLNCLPRRVSDWIVAKGPDKP